MTPNHRGKTLIAYACVFMTIAVVALALRFWSRSLGSSKRGPRFWWDDWAALMSLPFILTSHALVIFMTTKGLGQHIKEIPPQALEAQLKALYACQIIYDISISLPKTSVLLFYARVFTTQSKLFRTMLWITHFMIVAWLVAIGLVSVFPCDPIAKEWIPTLEGHCKPNFILWLASAVPSVAIDLILLLLPLPILWNLRLALSRKLLIIIVFACGYCVIVISLGRLITVSIISDALNQDISWSSVPVYFWFCAEAPVSVLSICLPTIFSLYKRLVRQQSSGLFSISHVTSRLRILRNRSSHQGFRDSSSSKDGWQSDRSLDQPSRTHRLQPASQAALSKKRSQSYLEGPLNLVDVRTSPANTPSKAAIPDSAIRITNDVRVQSNLNGREWTALP